MVWQNDFFSFLNSVQHEKGSSVDKLKLKHSPLKKIPKLVIVELGLSKNIKSVGIEKGFLGGVIVVSNFLTARRRGSKKTFDWTLLLHYEKSCQNASEQCLNLFKPPKTFKCPLQGCTAAFTF